MTLRSTAIAFVSGIALVGCAVQADDGSRSTESVGELRPDGKGGGLANREAGPSGAAHRSGGGGGTNGISYHGGPVVLGTPTVNYIWYGDQWTGNTAPNIIGSGFINALGASSYEHINSTYTDGSGNHVSGTMAFGSSYSVNAYLGASLSDAQILQVVSDAIAAGHFTYDPNALYFVLTSQEVTASSGFCSQYCGWHNHGNISTGQKVRYSFVGNPDRCPSSCEAQTTSPNGNPGADGMASIIAHESEETFSDPDGNAWYDTRGYENADKCAWTFGTEYTAANGSKANISLGGRDYLIQQNWVNAGGGYCAMSY